MRRILVMLVVVSLIFCTVGVTLYAETENLSDAEEVVQDEITSNVITYGDARVMTPAMQRAMDRLGVIPKELLGVYESLDDEDIPLSEAVVDEATDLSESDEDGLEGDDSEDFYIEGSDITEVSEYIDESLESESVRPDGIPEPISIAKSRGDTLHFSFKTTGNASIRRDADSSPSSPIIPIDTDKIRIDVLRSDREENYSGSLRRENYSKGFSATVTLPYLEENEIVTFVFSSVPSLIQKIDGVQVVNGMCEIEREIFKWDEEEYHDGAGIEINPAGSSGDELNPFSFDFVVEPGYYFFANHATNGLLHFGTFIIEYDGGQKKELKIENGYAYMPIERNKVNITYKPVTLKNLENFSPVSALLSSDRIVHVFTYNLLSNSEGRSTAQESANAVKKLGSLTLNLQLDSRLDSSLLSPSYMIPWTLRNADGIVKSGDFNTYLPQTILATDLEKGNYEFALSGVTGMSMSLDNDTFTIENGENITIRGTITPQYSLEVLKQVSGQQQDYSFMIGTQEYYGSGSKLFAVSPGMSILVADLDNDMTYNISIDEGTRTNRLILGDVRITRDGREQVLGSVGSVSSGASGNPIAAQTSDGILDVLMPLLLMILILGGSVAIIVVHIMREKKEVYTLDLNKEREEIKNA